MFNIEIIYYSNAMKYLSENDASLHESMLLASELGYEAKNITSELLVSLLASENSRDEFSDIWNKVESNILELK